MHRVFFDVRILPCGLLFYFFSQGGSKMNKKLKCAHISSIIAVICFVVSIILFVEIGVLGVIPCGVGCYLLFLYSMPIYIRYFRAKKLTKKILSIPPETRNYFVDSYNSIRIEPKSLDEIISFRYGIKNTPALKYLCDIIINTTDFYNKENNTHVSRESVASMLFEKQGKEIEKLSLDDIKNSHFGFFNYITIYCVLLSDKAYREMKYQNEDFNKSTFCIDGYLSSDLKKRFLEIMDDCYIAWHINALSDENIQSIDDLKNQLSGTELFDLTLSQFMKEYNQSDDSFIKI